MNSTLIQKFIENEKFIMIFDDNAEESFCGYLTQQSDELVQFESYDTEGKFDGIMIVSKEDISRIRWSFKEIQQIEDLISERNTISSINLQSISHAARALNKDFGYLNITMGGYRTNKIFMGEVSEDYDDSLILHEYTIRDHAERNFCLLRWDDITRVCSGGIYDYNLIESFKK